MREEENTKANESKHFKKVGKGEDPEAEEKPWYETTETSQWHRPRALKRVRRNPFTIDVLEDPLPSHFKPVSYEYNGTTDLEDHVSKFENVALLHQYIEGVKCRVFSTTLVGTVQQWFKKLPSYSITSF